MSAFSIASIKSTPATAGGDGIKILTGTLTGTSSYDTGGSILDLSDYIGSTLYKLDVSCDSGDYTFCTDVVSTSASLIQAYGISYVDVTYAHDGALFNATSTSDTTTWQQPANTVLLGARMTLNEKFVASGLSNLVVIIGDGSDDDGIMDGTANLASGTVGVQTTTLGDLFLDKGGYHATAATNLTLTATATGANLSTTSAGSITIRYYYVPGDAYKLGTANSELISTFDLSGETIRFVAIGTDA